MAPRMASLSLSLSLTVDVGIYCTVVQILLDHVAKDQTDATPAWVEDEEQGVWRNEADYTVKSSRADEADNTQTSINLQPITAS
ncbi:hypothetical protein OPT61_g4113 [Boeremia exigua]|uniref:Uncharacterized protein n=1 Tax=Boeremia exigua TaxID=749465 RepID=A0ACC2IFF3_9PLEO|nr:hypothetical protein OPT61_g4113 [Boeremia exigua]